MNLRRGGTTTRHGGTLRFPWMRGLLLGPVLLIPTAASAVELWGTGPLAGSTVQVQNDFELRYHHVPEKLEFFEDRNILDYWEQVDRLNSS